MKLGIMQPYFLPYFGYFQLMAAVDIFVVYDNIKFTKKGWINRNRLLLNGQDSIFSLPIKKDSDSLDIVQRVLSTEYNRKKLLAQFNGAYHKAPYFDATFQLLERVVDFSSENLFEYIKNSLIELCRHLEINTEIRISSSIPIDHSLKSQNKVLAICEAMNANIYINAYGGTELYDKKDFRKNGIDLRFIKSEPFEYDQFNNPFVPFLSIIDVLMFNHINIVKERINLKFELI
jgi:hypothetical protein